ncbi:hypothetical protein [Actinomadura sp. 6N118]|uniref:hypothetical protein n=1 Tax=Actinomadura sp. 6N118 TaxID=3375151 RepID=UPI0037952D62
MPWDGTFLFLAELHRDGTLGEPRHIAGGTNESIFQPDWSPDGVLHFISDRSGWWNLHRWTGNAARPVRPAEEEHAVAQWEFGYSTYSQLATDTITLLAQNGGRTVVRLLHRGELQPLPDLPFTSIKPYLTGQDGQLAIIGSSPDTLPGIQLVNLTDGSHTTLAAAGPKQEAATRRSRSQ